MLRQKIKSAVIQIVKLLITIGVIYWIIQKFGWEQITSTISSANPVWILTGVLLFVVSILLGALQWRSLLLSRGISLPVRKTISVYFTGIFFNNFMLGMVAGDSYKVAHLHFNNQKAESSFAATFFDRIAGLLVISLFAMAGGLYLFITGSLTTAQLDASMSLKGALLATFLFSLLLIGFFLLFLSKRLQGLCIKATRILPEGNFRSRVQSVFQELFIDRHDAVERKTFLTVLFYSFWIQLLRVTVHVTAALSLGVFRLETLHYFFIFVPIVAIFTIIPLPMGIKETIGGTLFSSVGYSSESAFVMQFLATLIGIGGSLFGGITFVLDKKRESKE